MPSENELGLKVNSEEIKSSGEEYADWKAPETGSTIQNPPKEKRFSVSREQFSKDRLKILREGFNQLQSIKPEVVAISLFGSMTKGNAKETSDIDGRIFIDTELARNGDRLIEKDETTGFVSRGIHNFLKDDAKRKYELPIKKYLKKNLGLRNEQLHDLIAMPINHDIVDEQVEGLLESERQIREYNTKYNKGEGVSENHPMSFGVDYCISSLFHLQIGKGLDKYRSYLIDKLKEAGNDGEQVWHKIVKEISVMEEYNKIGDDIILRNINIPETLERASEIYQKK